jgi:hypothetical protein
MPPEGDATEYLIEISEAMDRKAINGITVNID